MLQTVEKLPLVMRRPTHRGLRGPLTAQPLPLRWRRAKRWAERTRCRLDLPSLKQMVAAERVGSG
jgi:hypothetical protein